MISNTSSLKQGKLIDPRRAQDFFSLGADSIFKGTEIISSGAESNSKFVKKSIPL